MRQFFKNNGLSIVLLVMFLGFWGAQAVAGFKVHNEDQTLHGGAAIGFKEYLASGHFWQATGENWESEFLQMGFYVILTARLFQRGSAESNDPEEAEELAARRRRRRSSWLYRNSLSLAFLGLFVVALALHAVGGLREFNEERAEHSEAPFTMMEFLNDAEFWFQSFQNWQKRVPGGAFNCHSQHLSPTGWISGEQGRRGSKLQDGSVNHPTVGAVAHEWSPDVLSSYLRLRPLLVVFGVADRRGIRPAAMRTIVAGSP